MPRKQSWSIVLFLYDKQELKRIERTPDRSFHIGIWWHDTQRIVAFLQSLTEIKEPGNLIDAELSHDECWNLARLEFSCAAETEYFDLPRGRIVWDTLHRAGLLYHGNSTPLVVFVKLARLFRLPRWEARLDEHYLTGEALEAFYGLE